MEDKLVLISNNDTCLIFKFGKRTIITSLERIQFSIDSGVYIASSVWNGYLGTVEIGSIVSDKIIEWYDKRGLL